MSGDLPAPAPPVNLETARFWAATAEGRLELPRCDSCGNLVWYPRGMCPWCSSTALTWEVLSGRGTVYSFTIIRKAQGRWRDAAPYVLAYVELEEGPERPRLLTNVVGCDPEEVRIDLPVEVVFADTGEGSALPRFRPRGS
jgi:uncharacterized OB-fold protein